MELSIAETDTSTWHYHLRKVEDGKMYYGGAAPPAICGVKLGWDTYFPLSAWGIKCRFSHWCGKCTQLLEKGTE